MGIEFEMSHEIVLLLGFEVYCHSAHEEPVCRGEPVSSESQRRRAIEQRALAVPLCLKNYRRKSRNFERNRFATLHGSPGTWE